MQGEFLARATSHEFGVSKTGMEFVSIRFTIVDGPHKLSVVRWDGWLGGATEEKAASNMERTTQSLLLAGWTGKNFMSLPGLGSRDVRVVVVEEEYEGKIRSKVQWVNEVRQIDANLEGSMRTRFAADMERRAAALMAEKPSLAPRTPSAPAAERPQAGPPVDDGAFDAGKVEVPF